MTTSATLRRSECGSVLIIAVIAVMLVAIMLTSLSLLSRLEATVGFNYKVQAQAEATAEAGLDWARDQVRGAGGSGLGNGFTPWFDGTKASHMLTSGQAVGPFSFKARIDNDCAAANTTSTDLQESSTCTNSVDKNETAVLTSWAVVGNGRSRVRGWVYIDNPWKHVCANSQNDPGGPFCNSAGNTKGNPTVVPSDPQDPNGPRGFAQLPLPIIGCSRIDPTVHRNTAGCTALYVHPPITGYPDYPPLDVAHQLVLMGEDPVPTPTAKTCGQDALGVKYFGYFDCALRTPCPASVCGSVRKACIRGNRHPDTGVTLLVGDPNYFLLDFNGTTYQGTACGVNTGMVFKGSLTFTTDVGSTTTAYTTYVMHDSAAPTSADAPTVLDHAPGQNIYGTLVIEGNLNFQNKSVICTGGPAPTNPTASFTSSCGGATGTAYGYPMAVLSYDPKVAPPTVSPQNPQYITTTFGTPNAVINGQVYSSGTVDFNPINVNGSTVAFNINLQATSSTYTYVPDYGIASPPAGFPPGSSDPIVLMPKSFLVCNNYNDDSGGATTCN
jgi:hypothetical protein